MSSKLVVMTIFNTSNCLEIIYQKSEFLEKFQKNNIIFVYGATGCGKTTQIPQFIYEYYKLQNIPFFIGMTQPKRLSTIFSASRIGSEIAKKLKKAIKNEVGYTILCESTVTPMTKIKVMTEGILLKEIYYDFLLTKYNVIILDEVHERSINIDLCIMYLSVIVRKRSDLKIILMSATIEYTRYLTIFNDVQIDSFIVNTQSHTVSIFYEEKTPIQYLDVIHKKLLKLIPFKKSILVFLPSKKDIYILKSMLHDVFMDIIPLHSNLSQKDQNKIYQKAPKVILATNIAETSITIPDVYYVIDSGLMKNKYHTLDWIEYKQEFITKANAIQRLGRVGRTGPGVCFRIYSGVTYEHFQDEIKPESSRGGIEQILFTLHLYNPNLRKIEKSKKIKEYFNINCDVNISTIYDKLHSLKLIHIQNNKIHILCPQIIDYPVHPFLGLQIYQCLQHVSNKDAKIMLIICFVMLHFNIEHKCNTKSIDNDFIHLITLYNQFISCSDKEQWCNTMGISYNILMSIDKIIKRIIDYNYIEFKITPEALDIVIEYLVYLYQTNIAVKYDETYICGNNELILDKDFKPKYVIFGYIQCVGNNKFMRNILPLSEKYIKK